MSNPVPAHEWWIPGRLDQPTGGYRYDAAIIAALRRLAAAPRPAPASGRSVADPALPDDVVIVRELGGRFPLADDESCAAMLDAMRRIAHEASAESSSQARTIVVDGLALAALAAACQSAERDRNTPDPAAFWKRHRLVALVHHPLCDETGLDTETAASLWALERDALAWARCIVVTSPYTAARLGERFPGTPRAEAIVPALDADRPADGAAIDRARARWPHPRGDVTSRATPRRWLMVGSLSPRKGQDVLLEALVDVPDATLVLAGAARDPDYAAAIDAQIEHLGLASRVTRIGACSDVELDALYEAADAFVLPSRFEGFGMVITEAMQHRLPIVTTDAGALRDTARGTLQVPADDPQALAAAMQQVGRDAALRDRLLATAAATVAGWPDWNTQATRMAEILNGIDSPAHPGSGNAERQDDAVRSVGPSAEMNDCEPSRMHGGSR